MKLYVLHTLWSIKCHHDVGALLLSLSGMLCVRSEDEERDTDRDREILERDLRFDWYMTSPFLVDRHKVSAQHAASIFRTEPAHVR